MALQDAGTVVTVRRGLAAGAALLVATLTVLDTGDPGLTSTGWAVGLGSATIVGTVLAGSRATGLGPADLVTLTRLALACAVAGLAADSVTGPAADGPLVAVAAVALVLDLVDGRVARATGSASPFGARFDGEVDAFLLLVLSGYLALTFAPWVLTIGALRYLFAAAGWASPRLRGGLPPRHWRKVVTATQGVVMIVAIAGVAPARATYAALLIALAMLAESFGRDVLWLWRRSAATSSVRRGAPSPAALDPGRERS